MRLEFASPIATVDVVLLTLAGGVLSVALFRRDKPPFEGSLALPGGFVHVEEDEDLVAAARRVLRDKAGLAAPYLEQLATFGGRNRDERGWSISVAYIALVPGIDPAPGREVIAVDDLPHLPFDHSRIVEAAVARVRNKASYSSLPAFLLGDAFTLDELQETYERVLGHALDRGSFRRQVEFQGFAEPIPGALRHPPGRGRPAQLYRLAGKRLKEFGRRMLA
ncbi:NUDIX hydrolase [Falsiroseomonas sp. HW251]|uniref:NUDIX hydrolase n=1 Tax=Falsiroseomonas sp. HW251 TaxID=3390998 RepID=UPI003D31F3D7